MTTCQLTVTAFYRLMLVRPVTHHSGGANHKSVYFGFFAHSWHMPRDASWLAWHNTLWWPYAQTGGFGTAMDEGGASYTNWPPSESCQQCRAGGGLPDPTFGTFRRSSSKTSPVVVIDHLLRPRCPQHPKHVIPKTGFVAHCNSDRTACSAALMGPCAALLLTL